MVHVENHYVAIYATLIEVMACLSLPKRTDWLIFQTSINSHSIQYFTIRDKDRDEIDEISDSEA